MATLTTSTFSRYILTADEERTADLLTEAQISRLQNTLADIADSLINLDYTPDKPLEFAQNQAFLKGQRAVIDFILASHQTAVSSLQHFSPPKE